MQAPKIPFKAPFCATDTSKYDLRGHLIRQGYSADHADEQHVVFLKSQLWEPGSTIKVSFADDNAPEWEKAWVEKMVKTKLEPHVNLTFTFLNTHNNSGNMNGDIRVTFNTTGSFTQVGIGNTANKGEPSCHLEFVDPPGTDGESSSFTYKGKTYNVPANAKRNGNNEGATVIHEFGHAVGMLHEHQSPNVDFKWKCKAVFTEYGKAPNYWKKDDICNNILQRQNAPSVCECPEQPGMGEIVASKFDPKSIMLYPFGAGLSDTYPDGISPNNELSRTDVEWLSKMYSGKKGAGDYQGSDSGPVSKTVDKLNLSNNWVITGMIIVGIIILILILYLIF